MEARTGRRHTPAYRTAWPQFEAFVKAQARAIEERDEEPRGSTQVRQHGANLVAAQNDGQERGCPGAGDAGDGTELTAEDRPVEEEEGVQRLVPGRGADAAVFGQPGQKRGDLGFAHVGRVALVMEEDETANPGDVGIGRAPAEVADGAGLTDLVEEARRRAGVCRRGSSRASSRIGSR